MRNITQLCEQERYTKIARLSLAQKIHLEKSFDFQCCSVLALRMSGIYHKETLLLCFNACLLNILLFLRRSASWPASLGDHLFWGLESSHIPSSDETFHWVKATSCFLTLKYPLCFQALIYFCQASCQIHVNLGPSAPKEGTGGRKVLSPLLKAAPQWSAWLGTSCASRVTWGVINKRENKRAELPLEACCGSMAF